MIYEILPTLSNPHLPIAQFGDQIHFLNPDIPATNWLLTYDNTILLYIGAGSINNPGIDGWRFIVIKQSETPISFIVRATPGPPLDYGIVVDYIALSLLQGTGSQSTLIEGFGSTAGVEPSEFVPTGSQSFQAGAFQSGAFQ